jgi:hypothetical protein
MTRPAAKIWTFVNISLRILKSPMPNTLSKRLPTWSGKPAVRRSLAGLGIFLLLFSLFGYLILPMIIKSQAEKLISDKLRRPATIGQVEVNPYALSITVRELKVMEPKGDAVFAAFDALRVDLSSESMLRLAPVVQQVRLTKPYVRLVRTDVQSYNVDDIIELVAGQPPSEQPARFSINNIEIEGGRIEFEDRPAKAIHTVSEVQLGVPFISSLPSDVTVFVEPLLSAKVNGTPLLIKGKARPFTEPKDAVVELNLNDLDITRYLEYLPFEPRFKMPSARLDANLTASFRQPKDMAPALMLSGGASLKSLRITELNGKPVFKLQELSVTLNQADLFARRVDMAKIVATGVEADVSRDRNDQLNVLRLLPPPSARGAASAAQPAAASDPWHFALEALEVRGATLRYTDEQSVRPISAGVEKLDLGVRKIAVDTGRKTITVAEVGSRSASLLLRQVKALGGRVATAHAPVAGAESEAGTPTPPAGKTGAYVFSIGRMDIDNWSARLEDHSQAQPAVTLIAPLSLSMRNLSSAASAPSPADLRATVNKSGQLGLKGSLGFAPFDIDLAIDIKNVDILPLQPYLTDKLNFRLARANLSTSGRLKLGVAGDGALSGGFKGDMSLDNVGAVDKASTNDLMRWKSLSARGMDVRLAPFALTADQVALNDFFVRVIIDSAGRINIQDIVRSNAGDSNSPPDTGKGESATRNRVVANAGSTKLLPAAAGRAPPIRINRLTLQGGRVRFTDNFIRPNYTANLMNFGGVVTGLSSDASSTANLDLQGEVNRAPLSIAGRINPLRGDLLLDMKARVRGMEISSLSPYSGKYVGYGIEKGKLSFEIAYRVENRQLSAENRLILDQLTFGQKSASPAAMKLPVQLALALLQDRNGVIDINVPIGGSLDDPQFSIGGIIMKVIGNAIVNAVTKPFALLGAVFGGGSGSGEEMSSLEFAPGRSVISQAGQSKLTSLAKALVERPGLKLEITGRIDPEADRAGLKRASIDRKVRALKLKEVTARGGAVDPDGVVVKAEEYPVLLARVYGDEKIPKPRNLIGLPKALPVHEMEQIMIANAEVDDDDLTALGNRRAQAVKDWLLKLGQVSAERIFILAPKVGSEDADGRGAGTSAVTRVDFSLR